MTTFTTEDRIAVEQKKPLTDEHIKQIWEKALISPTEANFYKFARALEAAHGIF